MKKTSKILSIVTVIALIAAMSTGMCFAATSLDGAGEVPVKLTAPSISDAGIDFSVSDAVTMTSTARTTALTITDFVVTNNAVSGQLQLDKLEAVAETGWNLVADTTDFAKLAADTKEFSMVTEGQDLSAAAKTYSAAEKLVAPNAGTVNIAFTGKIGTFKTAIDAQQVAHLVPTLSVY